MFLFPVTHAIIFAQTREKRVVLSPGSYRVFGLSMDDNGADAARAGVFKTRDIHYDIPQNH